MKQIKYYTDYPIPGNPNCEVVEIEVLTYDRNKYSHVRCDGIISSIKRGYIFSIEPDGKRKQIKQSALYMLPTYLDDAPKTKFKALAELRKDRRPYVRYVLSFGYRSSSYKFSSLKDLLDYLIPRFHLFKDKDIAIIKDERKHSCSSWGAIATIDKLVYEGYPERVGSRKNIDELSRKNFFKIYKAIKLAKKKIENELQ